MKNQLIFKILGLLIVFSINANAIFAQTGKVAGRVTDKKTGETLIGLTVKVKGTTQGVSTDVEGRYVLPGLAPGKYTLDFSYVGYPTKSISDVVITAGKVTPLDVVMVESSGQQLAEVVIVATARKESVGALYAQQKNNVSISSGISSDVIRRSPDRNTGDVLKRVSGASIQDNKFVVVRGLSDRYNSATINNAALPSTEPDRKAFSFDIIPSNLVDRLVVNKTASPDLPGDFSGGVIQIYTKDVPDQNFLNISVSTGYNSISTFNSFRSNPRNSYDYFGFDDGTRAMPGNFPSTPQRYRRASLSDKLSATKLFPNSYKEVSTTALPGQNYQVTFGNRTELKNQGFLGTILSLTYRNAQNINTIDRFDYETERIVYDYNDKSYRFNTSVGLLANFAYTKDKNKIAFKNTLNRSFDDNYVDRYGYNTSNIQDVRLNSSELVQKSLISSQLEGNHQFGKRGIKTDWNLSYAFIQREQPDLRTIFYARPYETTAAFEMVDDNTRRFFSDLFETNVGGNASATYPFNFLKQKSTVKIGVNKLFKTREFDARIFNYQLADGSSQSPLLLLPKEQIFSSGNINPNGFVLNDFTNPSDKYDAQSDLNAGYVMFDNRFGEKVRVVWGARAEDYWQYLTARDQSNQKIKAEQLYLDILPSLNFTYSLTEKTNIRLAASQTVARPEFRELAPFEFYDFTTASSNFGNPDLKRTQIINSDLRYEYYPNSGEVLTVSAFLKRFRNPIEQVVNSASNADLRRFTYANAKTAEAYGLELEFRKKLDFITDRLSNFILFSNLSYIKSSVDLGVLGGNPDRALQGQSPYLINAGLQYINKKGDLSFNILYNKVGQRINSVGYQGYPDIFERGRDVLDFQLSKKVLKNNGELKLNVSDVLNQRVIFYQNMDNKDTYNSKVDRVINRTRLGTNTSLSFSYNFEFRKK